MRVHRSAFLAIGLLLAWCVSAPAQLSTASVTGNVRDATGAVVPGAIITLTNTGTNVERQTETNEAGKYGFVNLTPGTYRVTAARPGFATLSLRPFTLVVNQTATVDIMLAVGDVAQSITVEAEGVALQSSTAELGAAIEKSQLDNLPLNGRNFSQLLTLTPGVSPINVGQNRGGPPRSVGTVVMPSINGHPGRSNLFLLDGMLNFGSNQNYFIVTPIADSIQEFKVQSHNDLAEFGGAVGGVVNVATKSGTNQLHGSVWEFLRNDAFDARDFFQPSINPFRWNQFGAAAGGPAILPKLYNGKDRTFFFLAYQGYRLRRPAQTYYRVPTEANLRGDLSDWPRQIFNPLSTRVSAGTPVRFVRDPFPGNRIPASLLHPGMLLYAEKTLPKPIVTGLADRNALDTTPGKQTQEEYHARVDHSFSSRDNLWFRWSGRVTDVTGSGGRQTLRSTDDTRNWNIAGSWVHTFDPSTVLQTQIGGNMQRSDTANRFLDLPADFARQVGFSENFTGNFYLANQITPNMIVPDFFSGGEDVRWYYYDNIQVRADLTKIRGAHSVKLGFDITGSDININPNSAIVRFATNQTGDPQSFGNTGSALASYFLNLPDEGQRRNSIISSRPRKLFAIYFQDQWRVSSKLTVNAGLRYDRAFWPPFGRPEHRNEEVGLMDFNRGVFVLQQPVPSCQERGAAPCIPAPPGTLPANVEVARDRKLRTDSTKNFQPRFGMAYRLRSKTVLRASFGVTFDNWAGMEQIGTNLEGAWPSVGQVRISNLNRPTTSQPTPTTPGTDPFRGQTTALLPEPTPFVRNHYFSDPHMRNPYSLQWTFGLQHQFGAGTVLSGHYVGSGNRRLNVGGLYNTALTPGPGDYRARQPFPYVVPMNYDRSWGSGHYQALQVLLNHRFQGGLALLVSYTFSKSIDTGCSGSLGIESCFIQDTYNIAADRSVSSTDIPHILSISGVYELPFGAGKALQTGSRAVDSIAGGWKVNVISMLRSGAPYNLAVSGDIANTGNVNYMRPNVSGSHKLDTPKVERWFNTSAFSVPAQYTFGNLGRNVLRSDGLVNFDLGLARVFAVTEGVRVEFRGEAFNAFNHPTFAAPTNNIASPNFGRVLALATGTAPRQLQLGLRVTF